MGSEGHYKIVKAAIEQECDVPVLGYMKKEQDIDIPSRHLGLIPAIERGELNPFFDKLAHLSHGNDRYRSAISIGKTTDISSESQDIFEQQKKRTCTLPLQKMQPLIFIIRKILSCLKHMGRN